MKDQFMVEAAKGAPAVAGTLASANLWVAIERRVHLIARVAYLLRNWWREGWAAWKRRP